ncbi:hypothetical protein BTM25_43890 [Actinomadura rubteroloni]|uniref:Uncharacterized protein n=1 Tax=Actinomadura rubteroloni TaxID=1926885 RepID=A0A2P4UDY4_9ACTN|nr:hypothetical protein [Actinomadura rubteroloni]POM23236.1 hypothetical protein BTM25_43890 [Actinomadura rubteroloni]
MNATGTADRTERPRRGPLGLLLALFVAAGLVFSYGLGHAPPREICTAHSLHAPADLPASVSDGAVHAAAPSGHPGFPVDACCLALPVLFGLLAFALAALPRRAGNRRPARSGWTLALPPPLAAPAPSLASLQVLRL